MTESMMRYVTKRVKEKLQKLQEWANDPMRTPYELSQFSIFLSGIIDAIAIYEEEWVEKWIKQQEERS